MAKLITPDGKQLNIFLNLDDNDDGNGANPLKYGSKNHSGMNFVVSAFRNFKMNYNTCVKLVLHNSSGQMELDIASLISTNPSASSRMTVVSGTTVYFIEDDLLLETTSGKITRMDVYEDSLDIVTNLNSRVSQLETGTQESYSLYKFIDSSTEFTTLKNSGGNILRAGIRYRISLIGAGGSSRREGNYHWMLHTAGGGGGSINIYYTPKVDVSYELSIGGVGGSDSNKETSIVFSDGLEARATGGENGTLARQLFSGGSFSYIDGETNSGILEFIDGAEGGKGWYYDNAPARNHAANMPSRADLYSGIGGDDSLGPSGKQYMAYTAGGAGGLGGYTLEFGGGYGAGAGGGYPGGRGGAVLIQWSLG